MYISIHRAIALYIYIIYTIRRTQGVYAPEATYIWLATAIVLLKFERLHHHNVRIGRRAGWPSPQQPFSQVLECFVDAYVLQCRYWKVSCPNRLCKLSGILLLHLLRFFQIRLGAEHKQLDVVWDRRLNVLSKAAELVQRVFACCIVDQDGTVRPSVK